MHSLTSDIEVKFIDFKIYIPKINDFLILQKKYGFTSEQCQSFVFDEYEVIPTGFKHMLARFLNKNGYFQKIEKPFDMDKKRHITKRVWYICK